MDRLGSLGRLNILWRCRWGRRGDRWGSFWWGDVLTNVLSTKNVWGTGRLRYGLDWGNWVLLVCWRSMKVRVLYILKML